MIQRNLKLLNYNATLPKIKLKTNKTFWKIQ